MTDEDRIRMEEQSLLEARQQGTGATLKTWVKLSGPGWLQSAITLGGGSLASALYLGVLTGFHMLWLQVLAMLLGVIMLGAIGWVTLSTGRRPFRAINEFVNPVLGWGWIVAVLLANLVWSLPQFALGTAAIQQNLVPALEGTGGKLVCVALILVVSTTVIWFYDSGARGLRIFEWVLKGMVGLVVVCFFGVVLTLALSERGLPWSDIFKGCVPDFSLIFEPAPTFDAILAQTGRFEQFWRDRIVAEQRDVMIAAAATAVGINMTFLLPYSMLRKGWNARFRGLAVFDLSTGLLVPFALATGCVVIASASQFHTRFDERLVADAQVAAGNTAYVKIVDARLRAEGAAAEGASAAGSEVGDAQGGEAAWGAAWAELPEADRQLAAMLLRRDAFGLASALEPLTGRMVAQYVFGLGVLGMAISTVIILMLISGFAVCEMLDLPSRGMPHRLGCLLAGIGALGPFVWTGQAKFWLAVPTSVFGMVLLPIAYWTFFLMMNSRRLMGEAMPKGAARVTWNVLMLIAAGVVTPASLYSIHTKAGMPGMLALAAFLSFALIVHLARRRSVKP